MQVELVKGGKPYVMFGDGTLAACKPISEADLAAFIADCVQGEDRVNRVLPIGGGSRPTADKRRMKADFAAAGTRCLDVAGCTCICRLCLFRMERW